MPKMTNIVYENVFKKVIQPNVTSLLPFSSNRFDAVPKRSIPCKLLFEKLTQHKWRKLGYPDLEQTHLYLAEIVRRAGCQHPEHRLSSKELGADSFWAPVLVFFSSQPKSF